MQPLLSGPEQVPASGKHPQQLVILLHGLGSDANDLFELVPYFSEALPDAYFVSLNAPFPYDMAPMGRQWFSLFSFQEESMLEGLNIVAPMLNDYIDHKIKALFLHPKDVALIGFSQGSMLATYTALQHEKPLGGVLAYSGALVGASNLKDTLRSKPEVCLVHGTADMVVPFRAFELAKEALEDSGVPVEAHARDWMGHSIDPECIRIGMRFLQRVFGVK